MDEVLSLSSYQGLAKYGEDGRDNGRNILYRKTSLDIGNYKHTSMPRNKAELRSIADKTVLILKHDGQRPWVCLWDD